MTPKNEIPAQIFNPPVLRKRQEAVPITGVWLRRIGDTAEVLVERDGRWFLVIDELADGNYSHMVEPAGILQAPLDPLERDFP